RFFDEERQMIAFVRVHHDLTELLFGPRRGDGCVIPLPKRNREIPSFLVLNLDRPAAHARTSPTHSPASEVLRERIVSLLVRQMLRIPNIDDQRGPWATVKAVEIIDRIRIRAPCLEADVGIVHETGKGIEVVIATIGSPVMQKLIAMIFSG